MEKSEFPQPFAGESPVAFADRAGTWYASRAKADHRKSIGLYLTPPAVARFMARQLKALPQTYRLLDPSAGAGILLCAAVEELSRRGGCPKALRLTAYEIDPELAEVLRRVLGHAVEWAASSGLSVTCDVRCEDFVLRHAHAAQALGGLLARAPAAEHDGVIANPPYFKIPKTDPRARACSRLVHGQPNIYGLFMGVGAAMLADGGDFVFIVPRSFASGPYFNLFRQRFFGSVRPELVHVFGSRRDAFSRDEVLQENVILCGVRHDGWHAEERAHAATVSTSSGVGDLEAAARRVLPLGDILAMDSAHRVLRLPASDADEAVIALVDAWPGSLKKYGLQISTGPVVPFRATELLDGQGALGTTHAPLLWLVHVHRMAVRWPGTRRKQDFIKLAADERRLLVPNRNYVLMRRFSAKEDAQRITAAPYLSDRFDCGLLGLENHLNYIHRPGGGLTRHEAMGLAALYNSRLLDTYFRAINGNTQVSATELRAMPLPAREVIEELGRRVAALDGGFEGLDSLVADVLGRSAGDSETDTDGDDPGSAADLEGARLAESPAE